MPWLRDLPIRRKLTVFTLVTSGALPWNGGMIPLLEAGCGTALAVPVGITLTLGPSTVVKATNGCSGISVSEKH